MLFDHQFDVDLAPGVSLGGREAMALEIAFPRGLSLLLTTRIFELAWSPISSALSLLLRCAG
jgi:hypothetical protein